MNTQRLQDSRTTRGNGDRSFGSAAQEASLGELLKSLSSDTGELVKQEIMLAKAELRQSATVIGGQAAKLGAGFAIAWAGLLAITAFLVIGLGTILDNYWLSALIVGVVFLLVGSLLAKSAMAGMRGSGVKPERTLQTLREDAAWAKQQPKKFTSHPGV